MSSVMQNNMNMQFSVLFYIQEMNVKKTSQYILT